MKAIFRWLMNPDNNPIMFAVAIGFCLLCVGISVLRVAP